MNESQSIDAVQPPQSDSTRIDRTVLLLALLVATHFVVDLFATVVVPLWPKLEDQYGWPGGDLYLYVVWSLTTSFCQLLFGGLSDRFALRWVVWVGPAMAIICLNSLGLTESPYVAAALLVCGGLGIAAFHPEAAATAGSCLGSRRSRAMSLFALGGYLGQAIGPTYSGALVEQTSLAGLVWGITWGVPCILVIAVLLAGAPRPAAGSSGNGGHGQLALHAPLILLLLATGATRVVMAMGAPLAIGYILTDEGVGTAAIGVLQSSFMAGIGVGGCVCAAAMRPRWERRVLWIAPLFGAVFVLMIPHCRGWLQFAPTFSAGLCTGVSMPVLIGYGQRLLPHAQRVASSLTMGVSWGLSAGVVAITMHYLKRAAAVEFSFTIFALAAVISAALAPLLPKPEEEKSSA
ncbi:MAG: MFS transporter [Pirellulaceae bacterium]|nr:MFS transporter [Pirellulaceae bacterium]MDP7016197.1 MFS transporter [Pirellulaceae bacterium]